MPDNPSYQSDRDVLTVELPPLSEHRLRAVLHQVLVAAESSGYPIDCLASYFTHLADGLPADDREALNSIIRKEICRWMQSSRPRRSARPSDTGSP